MSTRERLVLRVLITLEPGGYDREEKVTRPSYYAVWLARGDLTVYYGRAATRLLARSLVNEIGQELGVDRELEV